VATIESQVVAVVAAKFNAAGERRITSRTDLRRDLTADSLALVELVLLLESEFQIDIPDEEAEEIETVQQIVDYLTLHMEPPVERGRLQGDLHASPWQ
jgi:acyl carrier protein